MVFDYTLRKLPPRCRGLRVRAWSAPSMLGTLGLSPVTHELPLSRMERPILVSTVLTSCLRSSARTSQVVSDDDELLDHADDPTSVMPVLMELPFGRLLPPAAPHVQQLFVVARCRAGR